MRKELWAQYLHETPEAETSFVRFLTHLRDVASKSLLGANTMDEVRSAQARIITTDQILEKMKEVKNG